MELIFASAREQAKAISEKQISSEELTQAWLERIVEVNPKLNAVVQLPAAWCGRLARCHAGIPSLRSGQALPAPSCFSKLLFGGLHAGAGQRARRPHHTLGLPLRFHAKMFGRCADRSAA
jgi:hypothetical protein